MFPIHLLMAGSLEGPTDIERARTRRAQAFSRLRRRREQCSKPVDRFREGMRERTFPNDPVMVTE
ncbi:hypothetical protein GCM10022206_94970 [Streptomyces chiangmaiensis]